MTTLNRKVAQVGNAPGDSPTGESSPNDIVFPLTDLSRRLITVPYTAHGLHTEKLERADNGQAANGLNVKAGPGYLFYVWGYQQAAEQLYFQMFNCLGGPPTSVPLYMSPIPIADKKGFFFSIPEGLYFPDGIVLALSIEPFSYSAPPHGTCCISALYK